MRHSLPLCAQLKDLEGTIDLLSQLLRLKTLDLYGNPLSEILNCRYYILYRMPWLEYLDCHEVLPEHREHAVYLFGEEEAALVCLHIFMKSIALRAQSLRVLLFVCLFCFVLF